MNSMYGVSGTREDVQSVLKLLRASDSWKCEAYELVSIFDRSDIIKINEGRGI